MIFEMSSCGGCRTCEMACSFKHRGEFIPTISSLKILDRQEGPEYLVFIAEKPQGPEVPCDLCEDLDVPLCVQHCRKSEDLKKILDEFNGRTAIRGGKKGGAANGR
jgi:Fe-S-cluster-containing hydrogenase component 2